MGDSFCRFLLIITRTNFKNQERTTRTKKPSCYDDDEDEENEERVSRFPANLFKSSRVESSGVEWLRMRETIWKLSRDQQQRWYPVGIRIEYRICSPLREF